MSYVENYDPSKPVCDNQSDFNEAVNRAMKANDKRAMKKARPWLLSYSILWLLFLVWALILAMRIPPGPERIEHILFALLFSPMYVISYYLSR
jgi:hypothetical protein